MPNALQVLVQQRRQRRRARDDPGLALGPVLELTLLPAPAAVGPRRAGLRGRRLQQQLAPALGRQREVHLAQRRRLRRPQRREVHRPEERHQRRPARLLPATAASSARACSGSTTTRRSTAFTVRGAFHAIAVIGFLTSNPRSTAYSARLTSTPRWRCTVAAAARSAHAAARSPDRPGSHRRRGHTALGQPRRNASCRSPYSGRGTASPGPPRPRRAGTPAAAAPPRSAASNSSSV